MATQIHVRENTTPVITAVIKDENDNVLPDTTLDTLTLTLYDPALGTIFNSRDGQDILNANDVTVDNVGLMTWVVQVADIAIVDSNSIFEERVALIEWTWTVSAATRQSNDEIRIHIQNLAQVP